MEVLKAGTPAPQFELNSTPDQRVALSEFRGHRLVLAFYPADWSPICGDQLASERALFVIDEEGVIVGAMFRRSALILAPTGSSRRWKKWTGVNHEFSNSGK